MEILKNEYCEIYYLEDVPCIHWSLIGSVSGYSFKESVLLGIDIFREIVNENANISLIVNLSSFAPEDNVDLEWVNNEIIPFMYMSNGVRIIAMVLPQSESGLKLAADFAASTEQFHVIGLHKTFEESVEWIRNGADDLRLKGDYTLFENGGLPC